MNPCTYAKHLMLPLLFALAFTLPTGCGSKAEPAPAASAEEAVQRIAKGLEENKPVVLWQALPASYQKDIHALMHEAIGKIDEKSWEDTVKTAQMLHKVLRTKKEFIINHPIIADMFGKEKASKLIDGLLPILGEILDSDLAYHSKAKTIDLASFLDTTGSKIMAHLLETVKSLPGVAENSRLMGLAEELRNDKATKVSGDGDKVVLRLEVKGKEPKEKEFVRVEGKWIPKEMADDYAEGMKKARAQLAAITDKDWAKVNAILKIGSSDVQAQLTLLEQAATQEEFNTLLTALMERAMGGIESVAGKHTRNTGGGHRGPIDQYFYDVNAKKLFVVAGDKLPPIDAPSGKGKAFKAYVFSCGDCSNEEERFVGYYEGFTAEYKAVIERAKKAAESGKATGPEDMLFMEEGYGKGRLISTDAITWFEQNSPEGIAINHELSKKCEIGGRLRPCYPGFD
ncbi:MAG: hypothetical protein WD768_22410 [Phycisphaeraceae bacterium]